MRCLDQWFDVRVIEGSADYARVVDQLEPAMCLMEAGIYAHSRTIANVRLDDGIPKAGFLQADAYCASRAGALHDFDAWGVESVFTMSVAMEEYTPDLRGRLFTWPNFIDPRLHHDRGLDRTVDVLLTGSRASHYPWRVRVARDLSRAGIPVTQTPHLGWFDAAVDGHMVEGVAYSRLLNSTRIAPSCGTIARDLVRKHLEIPGNGALLVAEPAEALTQAGFIDMQNCVLSAEDDAVDRIRYLMEDEDARQRIAAAGHDLVHSRHTDAHRSQVRQWLALRLQPGAGAIRQDNPFGDLSLGIARPSGDRHVRGRDRILLRSAVEAFGRGEIGAAERDFHRARNLHPNLEAFAGMAACRLVQGDGRGAADSAAQGLAYCLEVLDGPPDPSLLALLILAERSCGRGLRARRFSAAFPSVHLPYLDVVRRGAGEKSARPSPTWGSVVWPWLEPVLSETWTCPPSRTLTKRALFHERPRQIDLDQGAPVVIPTLRPVLRRAWVRGRSRAARLSIGLADRGVLEALADALAADEPEVLVVVTRGLARSLPRGVGSTAAGSSACPRILVTDPGPRVATFALAGGATHYRRGEPLPALDTIPHYDRGVVVILDPSIGRNPERPMPLPESGTVIVPTRIAAAPGVLERLGGAGWALSASAPEQDGAVVLGPASGTSCEVVRSHAVHDG